jgi:hypothetical protein
MASNGTPVTWCKKDYENAIRAFDYAYTLMMNLGAFMESEPKAYERFESL